MSVLAASIAAILNVAANGVATAQALLHQQHGMNISQTLKVDSRSM